MRVGVDPSVVEQGVAAIAAAPSHFEPREGVGIEEGVSTGTATGEQGRGPPEEGLDGWRVDSIGSGGRRQQDEEREEGGKAY